MDLNLQELLGIGYATVKARGVQIIQENQRLRQIIEEAGVALPDDMLDPAEVRKRSAEQRAEADRLNAEHAEREAKMTEQEKADARAARADAREAEKRSEDAPAITLESRA